MRSRGRATAALAVAFGVVLLVMGATAITAAATTTASPRITAATCDYDTTVARHAG